MSQAPAIGALDDVARASYTLIITYRRDGTPVATPVWAAVAGDRVYLRSERSSGKVKRLLSDPRALIAPCGMSGRLLGSPISVRGRVLDPREEAFAEAALAARHGRGRALFERSADAMRIDMAYLELTPDRLGLEQPLGGQLYRDSAGVPALIGTLRECP